MICKSFSDWCVVRRTPLIPLFVYILCIDLSLILFYSIFPSICVVFYWFYWFMWFVFVAINVIAFGDNILAEVWIISDAVSYTKWSSLWEQKNDTKSDRQQNLYSSSFPCKHTWIDISVYANPIRCVLVSIQCLHTRRTENHIQTQSRICKGPADVEMNVRWTQWKSEVVSVVRYDITHCKLNFLSKLLVE